MTTFGVLGHSFFVGKIWIALCFMLLLEPGTDVPLGHSGCPRGTTARPRPHTLGWGKGSRYKAHSAWALLHDISLRQKPGLKKIINKREPPTRLQEHQQRRRLLKL